VHVVILSAETCAGTKLNQVLEHVSSVRYMLLIHGTSMTSWHAAIAANVQAHLPNAALTIVSTALPSKTLHQIGAMYRIPTTQLHSAWSTDLPERLLFTVSRDAEKHVACRRLTPCRDKALLWLVKQHVDERFVVVTANQACQQ
jgi:hypothetical protein